MCFGNIKHSNMTPGKLFEQRGNLLTLRGLKWSKNTGKRDNTTKVTSKTKLENFRTAPYSNYACILLFSKTMTYSQVH